MRYLINAGRVVLFLLTVYFGSAILVGYWLYLVKWFFELGVR